MSEIGLLSALSDIRRWLTPEVAVAGIAAVFALLTLILMAHESKKRGAQTHPRIRASLRQETDENGWRYCQLVIVNRADCVITFTGAQVTKPSGFLLARGEPVPFPSSPDLNTASAELQLDWSLPVRIDVLREWEKVLFVRRTKVVWLFRPERAIEISFRVSVHDSMRRDIFVKVATNAVNWIKPQSAQLCKRMSRSTSFWRS